MGFPHEWMAGASGPGPQSTTFPDGNLLLREPLLPKALTNIALVHQRGSRQTDPHLTDGAVSLIPAQKQDSLP